MPDASSTVARRGRGPMLAALAILPLMAFYVIGRRLPGGLTLDLGSLNYPMPRYVRFVAWWSVCGTLSVVLLALASDGLKTALAALGRRWHAIPERRFLVVASAVAFAVPLAIRHFVLNGAPLSDDEGAYRFAAQLVSTGRLWVESPPMKLFFDQNFMINDGRFYPAYFLGWPVLLAPGEWIHSPGVVNPLLSAMTVVPLFRIMRQVVGAGWARGGILLFLSAPFIQVTAATELAHTSCLLALTWALSEALLAREHPDRLRHHIAFSAALAAAFCIRPQTTVPLTIPLLIWWGMAVVAARRRTAAALAFSAPAAVLALLFLGSLWAQTGSPWQPGYVRYAHYMAENDFRFSTFTNADLTPLAGFNFSQVAQAAAHTASGLLRLNADLFGWPVPFPILALVLAGYTRANRLAWWMLASYVALMFFQHDWGIDTFGPMHAFELALPILVLTMVGLKHLGERQNPRFASVILVALITTAWIGFVPVRLGAVRQIAAHVNVALRAPERAGLHRAAIFAPLPFAPRCGGVPGHFVVFRPPNDPDLRDDVLWVNHLSVDEDRQFVRAFPDRTGYVMLWNTACGVTLIPVTDPGVESVPSGRLKP